MGLVVTIPAAATDLTTVDTVKAELGLTGAAENDALRRLIGRVSSEIRDRAGQGFTKETVRETLPGTDTERLLLARTPLVSLTSVTIDGGAVTDAIIEDAEVGILYRAAGWWKKTTALSPLALDPIAGRVEANIVVTYVGGFALPSFDAENSNLPGILEELAIQMVVERYRRRGTDRSVTSEGIGDYSVVYGNELRERIEKDLAPFMRIA